MMLVRQSLKLSRCYAAAPSAALLSRIHSASMQSKITSPENLIPEFKDGMAIGWSGFTPVNTPKIMPNVICEHVEKNKLQGKMKFHLFLGASTIGDIDDRFAKNHMVISRWPYQTGKAIQDACNNADQHVSKYAINMFAGHYQKSLPQPGLDVAILEATEILEDGSIVLGGAVGAAVEMAQIARKIIIEVNTAMPSYKGLHDIVMQTRPPHRRPFGISRVDDKIGTISLPIQLDKVAGIIESKRPDKGRPMGPADDVSNQIAGHLMQFFEHEVKVGRLPKSLLPLQSGVGNVANAVISGLSSAPFENLTVWTEVIQDSVLDLFDNGKLLYATATGLALSETATERLYKNWDKYSKKICLRPGAITNLPEIIRRLGVIAMNTPIEVDIYGHANSTKAMGTRVINGIGGSADFLRNAYISIMHTPSTRPSKNDPNGISCVVPFVTHVDHTEHDVDVFVTEQGLADLRGLDPRARAREMIAKCAHPEYRPILTSYLEKAEAKLLPKSSGNTPHLLDKAFAMHLNFAKNGTMKIDSW